MSTLHIAKDVFAFLMVGLLLMFASEETQMIDDTNANKKMALNTIPAIPLTNQVKSTLSVNQQPSNCFVVNYPIQIVFPNGQKQTVKTNKALDHIVETWFEKNPNANNEPTFLYPFEITMQNGRKVIIENEVQFIAIADACDEQTLVANHNSVDNFCFDFIYPMQLIAPDGTTQQVNNDNQVDLAIRTWNANNPNSTEEMAIQFPVKIKFDDDVTIALDDVNALSSAIQYCEDDSLEYDSAGEETETTEKKTSSSPYIGA